MVGVTSRLSRMTIKHRHAAFGALLLLAGWHQRTMPASAQYQHRPGDLRTMTNLKVGDIAPDFYLKTADGLRTVSLSSFRGKSPVVLIFGSYT